MKEGKIMTDKMIEIVEDYTSLVIALRMILEAAETKKMPPIGIVPTFNDSLIEDQVMAIFGLISGEKSK